MMRTTFVCRACNQTRSYSLLSIPMAEAYAAAGTPRARRLTTRPHGLAGVDRETCSPSDENMFALVAAEKASTSLPLLSRASRSISFARRVLIQFLDIAIKFHARTPKGSGGRLCVAMTSIAQLICALSGSPYGRELGLQSSVVLTPE